MAFNKVILQGRLTADVELKSTQSGKSVCNFTVAVDRKYAKDSDQKADFITCIAWEKTADFLSRYFGKGSSILVCGELQTRSWTDNNGQKRYATEVRVDEVSFCGSKSENEGNNTAPASNGSTGQNLGSMSYIPDAYSNPQPTPSFENIKDDSDLPF